MGISRSYRFIEGTLVSLFVLQAVRAGLGLLLGKTNHALGTGAVDFLFVAVHLGLFGVFALIVLLSGLSRKSSLFLFYMALLVAISRVLASVPVNLLYIAGVFLTIGFGLIYLKQAVCINWRTWVSVLTIATALDQMFRIPDTYDVSLRDWLYFSAFDFELAIPWFAAQVILSVLLVFFAFLSRRNLASEQQFPAKLGLWHALSLGALLSLEMLVFSNAGVIGRWSELPYISIVPWLLLATLLPLTFFARRLASRALDLLDYRLRGWAWLVILILLVIIGYRLTGIISASALIVGQLMIMLSLWWLPVPDVEKEGAFSKRSMAFAVLSMVAIAYIYTFVFSAGANFRWLYGQGLTVVLIGAFAVAGALVDWREVAPWDHQDRGQLDGVLGATVIIPLFTLSLLLSSSATQEIPRQQIAGESLRIATYNINGGYNSSGEFKLDLVSRTIETSRADVVVLQEVNAGRPVNYGIDEVVFLAQELGFSYQVFMPAIEHTSGVAILSRHQITEVSSMLLPANGRVYASLMVTITDGVSAQNLHVIGAQFAAKASEAERLQQYGRLVTLLSNNSPAVLAVDLGRAGDDQVYTQLVLGGGFTDPNEILGISQGYTVPADNPAVRHDYILLRDTTPLNSRQVESAASDHRLVVVDIAWPPN